MLLAGCGSRWATSLAAKWTNYGDEGHGDAVLCIFEQEALK